MTGIPTLLQQRLRDTLSRCGLFDSAASLRTVFTDARIYPWRDSVPDSTLNRAERVAALIDALHDQANDQGDNALVLFLRVLAEQTVEATACHAELGQLAADLAHALAGSIFICYKRHAAPDNALAQALHQTLKGAGYKVFIDKTMRSGTDWLDEIDRQIKASDYLIVLLSEASADSEMVQAEVQRAYEYRQQQGHPHILPVRIAYEGVLPYTIAAFVNRQQYILWQTQADTSRMTQDILAAIRSQLPDQEPVKLAPTRATVTVSEDGRVIDDRDDAFPSPLPEPDPRFLEDLEAPGGAVKLRDKLYIVRESDPRLKRAMLKRGTTTTIRAPRQTGKTSLLIRGLHHAQQHEVRFVRLNFQRLDEAHLHDLATFLHYVADFIAYKLRLDTRGADALWQRTLSPQHKLTFFMEDYVLSQSGDKPIVLAFDEADKLLEHPWHSDFFALLRSWHDERPLNTLWEHLNLVMVISTEPYLLIGETNQSPFNVGLRLYLEDFDAVQVARLNECHGTPVNAADLPHLQQLLDGHPYLTRQALYVLVTERCSWRELCRAAPTDQGPFGDHLRRYHMLLHNKAPLRKALQQIIRRERCDDDQVFFRLLRAGLVKGSGTACRCRCDLYRQYFEDKL
jgi:hypothetical protein